MKHLQLTPPLLIITMGYPGAGKTYFARQFAELYGLPKISEDRIRFELFENPAFNDDEAEIIWRVEEHILEEMLKTERTFMCEGMYLKVTERQRILNIAKKQGYRTLIVWLQTDSETSMIRSRSKDRRSPDRKHSFTMDQTTFERLRTNLQRPTDREVSVVISGKHAFKAQCLTVLRKIANMYGANPNEEPRSETPTGPSTRIPAQPGQTIIR